VQLPLPLIKNVVLVGGGHAHALVLRKWAMKPMAGVRLTVINPGPTAPYTGMLPGYVAGHYRRDELDIDLVRLTRFAGARLVLGAASSIDRSAKTVVVAGRPPIPYDYCSINVGITSDMPTIPGFADHATAAKPLGRFAERWSAFVEANRGRAPKIVVIGGGVGGCELALAMNHRLRSEGGKPSVTVVTTGSILAEVGDRTRDEMRSIMTTAGIEIAEGWRAASVSATSVTSDSGDQMSADFVVGAAGARPHDWLADLGLTHDAGFLTVNPHLQSVNDPAIFATGDCAHMAFAPRPKAGVFAVRQAPVLFKNLQASLKGKRLTEFDPQADYLKLISLGGKSAAADKFRRFVHGSNMWRLKDKIDRDFMDKLLDLPAMEQAGVPFNSVEGLAAAIEEEPPLCGGCGAKVGADILSGPLAALPASQRTDIVRLPGDDAALLEFGGTRQVITTDSLRAFTTDPYRMSKIAALHAMGDIWAMGAAPQAVLVTVTLPQLSRSLQSEWLAEIMAGAAEVLTPTGAEIVGGHTSMGAELSLGFSITGLVEKPPITLAGAVPGQALLLTRPIGSGVLLAAEMQLQADGADIEHLLDVLEQPQGEASRILADAGATAMTDVTGFGLAGHLFGMLRESEVAAELILNEIPFFPGSVKLASDGVRSHLHAANQVGVPITSSGTDARENLLFDPQTAGGFLASLPADQAEKALADLHTAGFLTTIIGSIVAGTPTITLLDAART